RGHRLGVLALAHARHHPLLVSGGGTFPGGELHVWDLRDHSLRAALREPLRVAVPMIYYFDPRVVYSYENPHTSYQEVLAAHTQAVYAVAASPDARLVASGGRDRLAKLWEWETGRVRFTLAGHGGTVVAVSFPPDGATLLTADEAGTVRLWDVETGRLKTSWDWRIGRLRS